MDGPIIVTLADLAATGRLAARLARVGFDVLPAQGTYFLVADFRRVRARARCAACAGV